jgi:hypothetical protein
MQTPLSQPDANFKIEKVPAKVQNNFPEAFDFLQKRADSERLNLQAADFQMLTLNEQRKRRGKWQRNR